MATSYTFVYLIEGKHNENFIPADIYIYTE